MISSSQHLYINYICNELSFFLLNKVTCTNSWDKDMDTSFFGGGGAPVNSVQPLTHLSPQTVTWSLRYFMAFLPFPLYHFLSGIIFQIKSLIFVPGCVLRGIQTKEYRWNILCEVAKLRSLKLKVFGKTVVHFNPLQNDTPSLYHLFTGKRSNPHRLSRNPECRLLQN